jgi:YVTN family beta-propeller protein
VTGRRVERFLTTVFFTDIVGSTELAAELGDRAWRDLVQEHHKTVRAALRRHGGREVDTAGDSFFAVFDAPAAAVECALDVGTAVQALGLQVRAGLHVGEVEQIAGKVGGITVPIGSRIMAAAGPGEVLVSATLRDLAAGAGLHFEDRGTRELKGVPGEWRLYAVTRTGGGAGSAELADTERSKRRATAVRRARSRPVWQRHPRAVAGVVLGLVVVMVGVGLWVWSPWLPPAIPAVAENSVGVIDPGRNVIVGRAAVGNQPAAIAVGEGSVWIANTGDGTVSQVDPETHSVIDTIDVGRSPTGIAVGAGSVWVANSGERSVTRINAATRRVVDTVAVGNGPRAIAFGADALWVANAGDGTVTRIDPASGAAGDPIGLASLPSGLAVDDGGTWVTSEEGGTVTHLDPKTGVTLAAPVAVGSRPDAVAIGAGAVWVANFADGSVSRVDPSNHRVTGVIDVGGTPVGLAVSGEILWVADSGGGIQRVDLGEPSAKPILVATGAPPQALAVVGNELWFVSRASAASHRGGTLRAVSEGSPGVDPATLPYYEFGAIFGDGLVGYRRVGGIAGTQLLPDLAESLPRPSDGGLSYAFHLRAGLVYSDGSAVRPDDFLFAFERLFQVNDPFFEAPLGPDFYSGIKGADACAPAGDPPIAVERCDLSAGVVPDDATNTVTFHLSAPDPDFLYKLAEPFARPVPRGSVPANDVTTGPNPVTGPYRMVSVTETEIKFERNPHFRSWDPSVRPDGFADQIIWTTGIQAADQARMVGSGDADYMAEQIPADAFPELRTRFTPQLHIALGSTTYLFMNTKKAPFDQLGVRRAVAFALDRGRVVELRGGSIAAQATCQILPPNFPGYQPYCPFTKDPGPSGRWTGPDLAAARALVAASGTAGMKVVVGPLPPRLQPVGDYVVSVLRDLGYDASQELATSGEEVFKAIFIDKRVQMGGFEFGPDFPAPDTFLGQFICEPGSGQANYCGADLDALIAEARDLQATDPVAANAKWAEVDRTVTDLALWATVVNEGSDFVSARLGNYQFNPAIGILLDQAWVQ